MTEYDRWYIVPAVGIPPGDQDPDLARKNQTAWWPAYYDDYDALAGFAGRIVAAADVKPSYAGLIQTNPDVDPWYIVRFYGSGNAGWQALNQISVKADTRNLATNPQDVAAVLNQRFPSLERSAAEWEASMFVQRGRR
ncbi:hypothetical protein [Halomarina litorea]|uniref:hypothetical protein n=1 Tax=Halomarina litorea TaxID=2961595 RepID=UPI0020C27B93|nr:hypothetical protein [Halomarina sp. BCD28]